MRCTKKAKQTGERCKNNAVVGMDCCHIHGGKSKKGVESPTFKHGRYIKTIPDNLQLAYKASLQDEERHDLRDEIALAESIIADRLTALERGEADSLWIRMHSLYTALQNAAQGRRQPIMAEILAIIERGGSEALARRDIAEWIGRKQRAVEADVRAAATKSQMVAVEDVMALLAAVLEAIRRNVEDSQARERVARDIRELTSGDGVVSLDAARGA